MPVLVVHVVSSPAVVVVYVRQPHEQTKQLAKRRELSEDLQNKRLRLTMHGSGGQARIDLWTAP